MTYTMYNTHAHWSMVIQHLCSLPSQFSLIYVFVTVPFRSCWSQHCCSPSVSMTLSFAPCHTWLPWGVVEGGDELVNCKIWNSIQNSTQGELGSLWWVGKFINSKAFCGSLAPVEFNHRLNFYFFVDRCSSTQSLILSCKTLRNQIKNVILIVKCLHERVGSNCT